MSSNTSASDCKPSDVATSKYEDSDDLSFDELRTLVGNSFAGTNNVLGEPGWAWVLSNLKQAKASEETNETSSAVPAAVAPPLDEEKNIHFTTFCITMELDEVLVVHQEDEVNIVAKRDEHGNPAAAIVALEKDPNHVKSNISSWLQSFQVGWSSLCLFVKLLFKGEFPDLLKSKEHKEEVDRMRAKGNALLDGIREWHTQYGPQERHIYIKYVACHPDHGGHGNPKHLMNRIFRDVADPKGMDCYLECNSDSLKRYYEKLGYVVVGQGTTIDPTTKKNDTADDDDSKEDTLTTYCMIRKPASSTSKVEASSEDKN